MNAHIEWIEDSPAVGVGAPLTAVFGRVPERFACPPGQVFDPATRQCVQQIPSAGGLLVCPPGQQWNSATGRCVQQVLVAEPAQLSHLPQMFRMGVGALSEGVGSSVQSLQISMNFDITGAGLEHPLLATDGIAGDRTCAAARFLNTKSGTPYVGIVGAVDSYPADELCAMAQSRKQPPASPPPPPPPPTQCLPGQQLDLATGKCVGITCPAGQQFDPATNQCLSVEVSTGRKRKSNWGLALIGAAVVAAGAFALS